MRLVYSEEAVADLTRLRSFIAENDPTAAARIAAELISRIDNIRLFPEIGRSVPLAPEPKIIRDAFFGKYVVRYASHPQSIVILRIWHHYEDRQ